MLAESSWQGRLWLVSGSAGKFRGVVVVGRGRVALLLWAPLPFYALSVAYGSVPIFVPTWWPFSQYNVRYGLQLLPAFAVFVPMGISFLVQSATKLPQLQGFVAPLGGCCNRAGNLAVGGVELCRDLARRSDLLSRS